MVNRFVVRGPGRVRQRCELGSRRLVAMLIISF
jgi:hypothetical protein